MATNHELVETSQSAETAYAVLHTCPYIFIDCEGRDLGTTKGALGLIQLGTPHAAQIFLIDAPALSGDPSLALIFSLLSDKNIVKIVWDGRMDDSELFFGHRAKMLSVLDLQIVDVASRRARAGDRQGEYEHERLKRMSRREFPLQAVKKCQTEGLHVLNSMDRAIAEHGLQGVPQKDASVKSLHWSAQTCVWMERPLTPTLLEYAASDISRIAALFDHFVAKGYIPNFSFKGGKFVAESINELARLLAQSQIYISRHRKFGRPESGNAYVSSEFLPSGVLWCTSSTPFASEVLPLGQFRQCKACMRKLDLACFPFDCPSSSVGAPNQPIRNGIYVGDKNVPRTSQCRVCTLLDVRAEARSQARSPTASTPAQTTVPVSPVRPEQSVPPVQQRLRKQRVNAHNSPPATQPLRQRRSASNLPAVVGGASMQRPQVKVTPPPRPPSRVQDRPPRERLAVQQRAQTQDTSNQATAQQIRRRPSQTRMNNPPRTSPTRAHPNLRPSQGAPARLPTNSGAANPPHANVPQRARTDPGRSPIAANGIRHAHFSPTPGANRPMSVRSAPATQGIDFDTLVQQTRSILVRGTSYNVRK